MKSIELFCASPSSSAICSSTDQRAIIRHGMRPIGRENRTNAPPCYSQIPFDPSRPFYSRKKTTPARQTELIPRRKSSADVDDLAGNPSSSRYLLSDQPMKMDENDNYKRLNFDGFPGFRSFSTRSYDEYPVYKPSLTRADRDGVQRNPTGKLSDHLNADQKCLSNPSNRQVVELRVSIHCKGCEGKLRKYISRMEGVTSFSIDLATKKVTVIGNVTPLGVLTSISKVKNAQFWPSPTSSTSSSSSASPRVSLTRFV